MNASGNKPPATVPAKGKYMMRDLQRNSEFFNLKLKMAEDFPANTMLPMRFLTVVSKEAPQKLESVSEKFFQRYWGEGQSDVTTSEGILAICETLGISRQQTEAWLTQANSPAVKEELKATTDEAGKKRIILRCFSKRF